MAEDWGDPEWGELSGHVREGRRYAEGVKQIASPFGSPYQSPPTRRGCVAVDSICPLQPIPFPVFGGVRRRSAGEILQAPAHRQAVASLVAALVAH